MPKGKLIGPPRHPPEAPGWPAGVSVPAATSRDLPYHFRISDFGLLSDFGFWSSDLIRRSALALALLVLAPLAFAQPRPYIGFVYPAGGQQGTTFQIRLGGQQIEDVTRVLVTGTGVTARIADNYRRLNFQELQVLYEQTRALRREMLSTTAKAQVMMDEKEDMLSDLATNKPAVIRELEQRHSWLSIPAPD